jgi:hypothetical protein
MCGRCERGSRRDGGGMLGLRVTVGWCRWCLHLGDQRRRRRGRGLTVLSDRYYYMEWVAVVSVKM